MEPGDSGQIVSAYGRFDLFGVEAGTDCASFSAAVAQIGEDPLLQRPLPGVIGAVAVDAETFQYTPEDGTQGVADYSQARLFICQGCN